MNSIVLFISLSDNVLFDDIFLDESFTKFFKTLRRNNNSIDVTNSMNNRNTINYFHKLNNHKKTKTVDIKDKCITDRSKFINYLR